MTQKDNIKAVLGSGMTAMTVADRQLRSAAIILNVMARRPQVKEAAFSLAGKHILIQTAMINLNPLIAELNSRTVPWGELRTATTSAWQEMSMFIDELEKVNTEHVGWEKLTTPVDFPLPRTPVVADAINEITTDVTATLKWAVGALSDAELMIRRMI